MARFRRDDDDDDDDDEKPRKKSRRPADDDEDDEPVRPTAKKKPAKPIDDDDEYDDDTPPPKNKPVVKAAPKKRVDDIDDEDDDPPPKKKPAAKKPIVDDDDEDDTPRKKKKPVAKEDDDDDDAPRKSKFNGKGKGKKGGLPKPLLIGGALALLFLICGGAALGSYFMFFNDSPKAAFEDYIAAVEKDDAGRMWDRMDKQSQDEMAKNMELVSKFGPNKDKYKEKKGKELFVAVVADATNNGMRPFDKGEKPIVESYTTDGSIGSVSIKTANGTKMTIPCVKEDGRWRLQFSKFKPSKL